VEEFPTETSVGFQKTTRRYIREGKTLQEVSRFLNTLKRDRPVGSGKLLLSLASTVVLGSESRGTHDNFAVSRPWESYSSALKVEIH
jgi:hypothetical protein